MKPLLFGFVVWGKDTSSLSAITAGMLPAGLRTKQSQKRCGMLHRLLVLVRVAQRYLGAGEQPGYKNRGLFRRYAAASLTAFRWPQRHSRGVPFTCTVQQQLNDGLTRFGLAGSEGKLEHFRRI